MLLTFELKPMPGTTFNVLIENRQLFNLPPPYHGMGAPPCSPAFAPCKMQCAQK